MILLAVFSVQEINLSSLHLQIQNENLSVTIFSHMFLGLLKPGQWIYIALELLPKV